MRYRSYHLNENETGHKDQITSRLSIFSFFLDELLSVANDILSIKSLAKTKTSFLLEGGKRFGEDD